MAPRKYIPPADLGSSQATAEAAAPAQPTLAPPSTRPQIDPHTHPQHDWYQISYNEPEAIDDEDFAKTVDSIVLYGDQYSVKTRLQSGTIRTDQREISPYETALMDRDKRRRQQNRYDEIGSSQPATDTPPTSPLVKAS